MYRKGFTCTALGRIFVSIAENSTQREEFSGENSAVLRRGTRGRVLGEH